MNKRSDNKTNITFELKTVENLRRSIKWKMTLFTCTVVFTYTVLSMLVFTTLFTHTERWRGIDQWYGIDWWCVTILLDKILMHCWSVMWQHVSGPKIVLTVHVYTRDYLQPNCITIQITWSNRVLFKLHGQTAYCWLMTWRNPEPPKCFWSDGHDLLNVSLKRELSPPNLASLNSFF